MSSYLRATVGSSRCRCSPERYWPDLCKAIGQPDMATDPVSRPSTPAANSRVRRVARALFAERDLDEWRQFWTRSRGVGAGPASVRAPDDPQVEANRYLADVDLGDGTTVPMVASPSSSGRRRPAAAADCGFIRLSPGAVFPPHNHLGEEAVTILSGRVHDVAISDQHARSPREAIREPARPRAHR
jgi:crotonobetainyl-CoA:carnitine CoA-transferase CaiB-like acyl-CoA transferase